jgi:Zn-dependent protease with chaperone function
LFWGVVGFAGWIVLFIILFFSGIILSNLTMKAIKKQVQFGVSKTTPVEKFLRWIYGIVIWVASGYFYISIPILILLIILSVAGLEYLLVLFGLVPFTLAMAILLFGFFTVVAIIRSLFIRRSKDVPGKPLSRQEVPELWRLLTDIASRLSTRPVKKVFVTPNTGIAVFERGNWLNKISNRGERCLILGLDTLNGLTLGEFQSVIAHEYGHFINADTARGNLAKRMQNNFLLMITTMSRSKLGGYYFPMFFFISLYNKIFLRISHGASRLQEIQADRLAASYFGISIFKKSLKHVIRNTIVFRYHLDQEVKLAQSNHTSLRNLYSILSIDDFGSMERDIRKVMNETTSPYDSHPSLMERFELIRNVSVRGSMVEDTRLVWDLLPNAENLQMEMTKNIEANLKLKGYLDPAQTGNS